MNATTHYTIDNYFGETPPPVFQLTATAQFSPIDINIAYLTQAGWNQTVDRLRFHVQSQNPLSADHPLAPAIGSVEPHIIIRRLDEEEDLFVSIQIVIDGVVSVMSNDREFAVNTFNRLLLDCPPGFHVADEFDINEQWTNNTQIVAYFLGILTGARGWDPLHDIPANIRQSLEEAHRSLEISNYRSVVVMSRRTLEAVLKFGFQRLLGREPVNQRGRFLMLNDMITQFRNDHANPIPAHLLHIADSVRLIGNVPGAHATEIPSYQFTRSDAEYAFYAVSHFLYEYFNKIDTAVTEYYTLTVNLNENTCDE